MKNIFSLFLAIFMMITMSINAQMASLTTYASGFSGPEGIAFDKMGNLFVANANNSTIMKVTPSGVISTFVNSGLNQPTGLAFDSIGNLYVANPSGNFISKVTPTGIVSKFVSGITGPWCIAFGPDGNLFAGTPCCGRLIYKITPNGVVSKFDSSNGGFGIAVDKNGNVYSSNYSNSTLTKLKTIFCLFFSIEYSTFVSILTTQIAMTIKDFQPHKSGLKNFCHLSKNISQQVTVTNSLRPKNTCSDFSSQTTAI
jgi:sugar lactone lactonase YvrE